MAYEIVFLWIIIAFCIMSATAYFSRRFGYWIIFSMVAGLGVIANVLASAKIIAFPFGLHAPAGILAYMMTFFLLDVLSEFEGKKMALHAIYGSIITQLACVFLIWATLIWPAAPFVTPEKVEAANIALGLSPRLFIAGLIAFTVSSMLNVFIYSKLKEVTKGAKLWLRNNTSTITSVFASNLIFLPLGYIGSGFPVMKMIKGHSLIQILIALIDTAFLYFVVRYTKNLKPEN